MVDIPLQMMEFFSKLKSQLQIVKTQQSFTECIKKFSSICRAKTVEARDSEGQPKSLGTVQRTFDGKGENEKKNK